jgi:uncharacterized membrane protein
MDITWISYVFLAAYAVLLVLIGLMLVSLARRGDERSRLIKSKAMSATFISTVVLLVVETVRVQAVRQEGTNPFWLLVAVSLLFLVFLMIYKKKFGDLG